MSLELDPPELGFARPCDREVVNYLKLSNPHREPIAFKVKTTAPKQYCVRPNSGRVEPGEEVAVQVILQAMKEDPPLDARCRDKFLVQSAPIPPTQNSAPITGVWQWIEANEKQSIAEKKIRVNFLSPGQSLGTPNRNSVNGVHTPISQQPPPYQPNEAFNTPVTNSTSGPAPHLSSRAGEPKGLTDIKQESYNPPMSTAPGSSGPAAASNAAAAVANAVPKSREELQQLYDGAQAEIKRLMASASASLGGTGDGGMRQRKGVAADAGAGQSAGGGGAMAVMGQGSASGVPIQITAALCLLSFLIAYLFF